LNGQTATKVESGQYRQICENGMYGVDPSLSVKQNHQEEFQPSLIHQGVQNILNASDDMEERLDYAREQHLQSPEEIRHLLHYLNVDWVLDNPTRDIPEAIEEERELAGDDADLSLFNAYNAGTRAVTHYADGASEPQKAAAHNRLSELLEAGEKGVPDADEMIERALTDRAYTLTSDPEAEEDYAGEREIVRERMEARGLKA